MSLLNIVKELKETASLVGLLDRLGYQPVPKHGREAMYVSMLRDNDRSPSLSVNEVLGVWYDHGSGKGGNIIDFGLAYWPQLTFGEVVAKLQETLSGERSIPREKRPRLAVKIPTYKVNEIKPLGTHPAITDYLTRRGIYPAARHYLQEVYYQIDDGKGGRRKYFAAGWQNELQSWEVRNRFFKGCMGLKGISFLPGDSRRLSVFEGFMDFLSWKTEQPGDDHSVIVLNSTTLLQEAIRKAISFPSIDIYFDLDKTGTQATREFLTRLPYATDRSAAYKGYNDYNAKLEAGAAMGEAKAAASGIFDRVRVPFSR
ncbi:toprim domain-containing protein [Mucilaginibacter lacusdianchii]|uniref:toprim domain-containing protein n=1 Tax=Mucilaginibacter lacusdianchii TaxID=2684211 RepID=UPI00131B45B9|nr:toprim domain-containing protein [Mucilaginibacter sp. JXJ CY 39]